MDKQRRLQKFSIRKYTVGTCSILLGTLIFLGSPTEKAFASEDTPDGTKLEESAKLKEEVNEVKEVNSNNEETSTNQPENVQIKEQVEKVDVVKQTVEEEKTVATEELSGQKETSNKEISEAQPTTRNEQQLEQISQPEIKNPETTTEELPQAKVEEQPQNEQLTPKENINNNTNKEVEKPTNKVEKRSRRKRELRIEPVAIKKAFGKDANDDEVPDFAHVRHTYSRDLGNKIEFFYEIHFNRAVTNKARGRFYVYAPPGVQLLPGTVEKVAGNRDNRWKNKASVVGKKTNAMVYQAMSASEREKYRNLTNIIDEDNFYYIHEEINAARNAYMAKISARVDKSWLRGNGGKFYVAIGVATENIAVADRMNHVNFVENREPFSNSSPTAKAQTVEINGTPNAEQSINTTGLPNGTRYSYTSPVNTSTIGNKDALVRVSYPSGNEDFVPVVVTVNDTTSPESPMLNNVTSEVGAPVQNITLPFANDNSGQIAPTSVTSLPAGLTYNQETRQITGTPTTTGRSDVNVTYTDASGNSSINIFQYYVVASGRPEKPVIQTDLTGQANTQTPIRVTAQARSIVELFDRYGQSLGDGMTSYRGQVFITPTRPIPEGIVTAIVTDSSSRTSDPSDPVRATSRLSQAERHSPTRKDQTVEINETPTAEQSINTTGLPSGTNYTYLIPINTNSTGRKYSTVRVTYPDRSYDDVPIVVNVVDTSKPVAPSIPNQTSEKGVAIQPITLPNATDNSGDVPPTTVEGLPPGLTYDSQTRQITGTATTEGISTVIVTYRDPSGNGVTHAFTYDIADTTPPAKPVIQTNLTGKAGTTEPITVNAEPGSNVELFDKNGNKIGEGNANDNGVATITPTQPLLEGNVTAKATDTADIPNTSEASNPIKATDTTPPAKPVIQSDLTGKAGTQDPITVNAEPESKVELFDKDGNKIGEGNADDNGVATITPTQPLPEGNVTAKATDTAEVPNTSVASDPIKATDTTPPAKPVIQTKLTGKAGSTEPITVNAEPGSKVELFDKDGNKIGEGNADNNGVATITPTQPLLEGNVTAKATDTAEVPNTSDASEPIKATDTTPPAKPVIQTKLTGKAGSTEPITVNAEPGSKVELFDKDGNKIGEGNADNNGVATITPTQPLLEGNVTAKATDTAEVPNTSDASEPIKATDTTPPAKPVIQTDLTSKAGTTEPITVNAEPGSKVELFDKDGNKIGEGNADDNGVATITSTQPLPEGNVTAKATDTAEVPNTSDASEPIKATDTTPPAKPVINTDLTGKAGTQDPITVNAEPGSKVELFDKDGNKIGEGNADDNGVATITPTQPLPEGNVTAKATDTAEVPNTSEASNPVKATDTTPPAKPVIQTDLTGKAGTQDPITVNAEPGSKVELFDKDGNKIGEGNADNNGVATITPTQPLPEGNVTAKATDTAEVPNTSEASNPVKATDTTPPAKPVIQTNLTGKAGSTDPITVQAEPGTKVELFDKDGNKIGEGNADNNGVATITPTQPLLEGNVTAKATDTAEVPNTSDASEPIKATDTTPPAKPVIQTDLTSKAGSTDPITVQAEPGSKVELFDKDGNKIGQGNADNNGVATITPTQPLPEGNVTAKATDTAEVPNTSDASEPIKATDTTPPAKPVINTDLTGKAGTTNPITVQAEPGSKVELFDKDGNKIGEGNADNNGVATITPTQPLPEGNVTVKATDTAENPNTSDASEPIKATDTTPPAKPVIQTDLTSKAGTQDPITVQSEPGSKVELFDKDGNKIGEGNADNNGVATITPSQPLPEGNVTVKATDTAENPNTSEASEPIKATDTTPPAKPVIQTDLTSKAGTQDPITVQAEPGSKVELFDKDGNKIGEGNADENGVATITPTQPLPEGNVTAKATDTAEVPNTSDASEPIKATDTTPPAKPVIQTDLTSKAGSTDPITVNAEPGSKVELFDKDGNKIGQGNADNNGVATITPTQPLPEGNVTAKATDTAENPNTSEASNPVKATDTTPPAKPVIQTDLTGKAGTTDPVTVQAEPGSKVELFDKDGNKIGEGNADNNGVATITPSQPLPEGNVTVKATDTAENPNTSEASEPIKATDTTPPAKPVIQTDLTGKAGTTEPITVNAEPGSKVELFDKDGNKIGEGNADDNGVATITPTKPLPEGYVSVKATDTAENPNTSEGSEPIKATDTTPPAKPVINTDLTGKASTTDPITVQAEPGSKVELFDKDGNKIGEGNADDNGVATITPTQPLPEGNVTAKATDTAEVPNTSDASEPIKATDTTPPSKPVIQTDLTSKAGTQDPITVQSEPGSKVELFDKDGNKIGEGNADENGVATITPTQPLPEGNVTVKATDTAENPNTSEASEPIKATDTTPPMKPVINTDLTGKAGTQDPITVQAEPGSKVELFDKDGNKIGEGNADENGVATITPTQPLPEGNISVKATDNAETPNTSESSEPIKATDTTPPAKPVINTDLTGKAGTTEPITVNAEPGSKVELFDKDGNKIGEGNADDNGVATITPTQPLPEGNVTAKATDTAETPNTSEASEPIKATDTTPPAKPVVNTDLTGKAGTQDPITVQAEPGSKVELFDKDGNKIGEGNADDNGVATITPTQPLPEGNVTVKATDTAEVPNTSEASEPIKATDTTPPAKPVVNTDLTGKAGTQDPITVNAEPGSKVELFDKDGNKIGEGNADNNGVATITPTQPLPEGNISVKATDNAETPNTSEASEPIKATDTTPPAKPVVNTDLTGKAGTQDPITVNAEPGSKVELFDKDGNKIGEGNADDNGVATITPTQPLPEGNVTVKATDTAEVPNTSEASEPIKATDTTPPAKPVINTDLTGKAGTQDPITVNAEPGSKVELFDKDGNKIGEGNADNNGVATITPTQPLPEGNVTAKATDTAENPNTSDASEPIKATDTTPPAKPVIQTDLTGKAGTQDPITVNAEPGSKVELFDKDGNKIGEGNADENGVATITPTQPLPEGNVTVKATDTAENPNTSEASNPIKATDTTPPAKPLINTDLTGKAGTTDPITVQAEPGSKVELFDKDGNKIGEGNADDQGNAVITPTQPLPEGNVTAKATDTAETPNTSEASDPVKATDTTPPAKPVIQTDLTGKAGTTDPVTVQAEPGSKVELFDKDGNKIGEGNADNNGVATITPTQPLPEGNISAKATDTAETPNTSEASQPIKATDTTPPAKPLINTDLTGKAGTTDPITVQAEPGSKVELFDKDGNKIGEGNADENGVATITPTQPLPEGNVTVKATDTAENPNTSEASNPIKATDTIPPAKPLINTDLTGKAGTTDPITVQAEPGSKVELFDKDGNKIGEGNADNNDVATITPTQPLPEGNVTVKATDTAENPNTSDASEPIKATDTTPPTKPVINTDLTGKAGTTDPITVQAEPGSKVELFDKDGNKIGEGNADNNGVATIAPTKPLPEGNVTVKATDTAENPNTSEASNPIKATDTTPPAKPVINTDLTGKAGTQDPITVNAEPGSKIELFDKDGNKIGEGNADNNGVATITPTQPLPEGNITAKATDTAEVPNTSDASEPIKATDTTPPAKPVINTDLTGKAGTQDPITVQAEPGSKVELFDKDGNKIGEGIADENGVATITPTQPLPEGNISVKATDNAETPNTSESSETIKATDTTPPAKPVINTDLTGKAGTTDPITVQTEPGSKVELFDKDGNKIGEGNADNNGVATITPTQPLPEGNVTVKATDTAEVPNTSEASDPVNATNTNNSDQPSTGGDDKPSDNNGSDVPSTGGDDKPGNNGTDQPNTGGDDKPSDNNGTDQSNTGGNGKPGDNNGTDQPNTGEDDKPVDNNGTDQPNTDGDDKPGDNNGSDQPNTGGDDKPGDNNGSDQPNTGGNDKPGDNNGTDQPSTGGDDKPGDNNGSDVPSTGGNNKPVDNNGSDQPNTGGNDKPGDNNGSDQPNTGGNDKPGDNNGTDQPSTGGNDKPGNNNGTDQPNTGEDDKPSDNNGTDQPNTGGDDKPGDNNGTDQPSTGGDDKPVDNNGSDQPSTGGVDKPENNNGSDVPSTGGNDKPVDNNGSDQPSTGGDDKPENNNGSDVPSTGGNDKPVDNNGSDQPSTGGDDKPVNNNGTDQPNTGGDDKPSDNNGTDQPNTGEIDKPGDNNGSNQPSTGGNDKPVNNNGVDVPSTGGNDKPGDNNGSDQPSIGGDDKPGNNNGSDVPSTGGNDKPVDNNGSDQPSTGGDDKPGNNNGSDVPSTGGDVKPGDNNGTDQPSTGGDDKPGDNNGSDQPNTGGNDKSVNNNDTNKPSVDDNGKAVVKDDSSNKQLSNTNNKYKVDKEKLNGNGQSSKDRHGLKELPNTGEQENKQAGLLGITSLFGGLALLFRRKKSEEK